MRLSIPNTFKAALSAEALKLGITPSEMITIELSERYGLPLPTPISRTAEDNINDRAEPIT